jgi:hypothetical protein
MQHTIFAHLSQKKSRLRLIVLVSLFLAAANCLSLAATPVPDPVLEWNAIMNDTILAANTSPLVSARNTALVAASVFDAVNGIRPRYEALHVSPAAPRSASQRAAAVQAAYAILIDLYPLQSGVLTTRHDASIATIRAVERAASVEAGMVWGQGVADAIWAWRVMDGFTPPPPPFTGVLGIVGLPAAVGVWRPTQPGGAYGAGPQFASMTPWVLLRPSQFRLPPPNALTSAEYATDYNEIKTMGPFTGSGRSADQSELALFWAGNTPLFWNRIAAQVSTAQGLRLSQNAHLFALLNIAMADAAIACWDAKYHYAFWRPVTAIPNDAVAPDPSWLPLLITPNFPEYPSAHATVSPAAAAVLQSFYGDSGTFTLDSDVLPGALHVFTSFAAAADEAFVARIYGGIHFRSSCHDGHLLGVTVGTFVIRNAARRR